MKKSGKILGLILIIVVVFASFSGCNNGYTKANAKSITFANLDKTELNFMHLESDASNKMCLVKNGTTDFSIYVSNDSLSSLLRAVEELKDVIFKMSGATIAVKNTLDSGKGIVIGTLSTVDTTGVQNDGFVTSISEGKIDIKGLDDNGTRNGVYAFMEDYLGVVFVSNNDTYIPEHTNIYLEKGNVVNNPKTAWRNVYSIEASRDLWCAKLLLNGYNVEKTDEQLGIKDKPANEHNKIAEKSRQYNEWGTWCHSYYSYLSPEQYYDTHPEYFSLHKGKRIIEKDGRQGQLCLSNPEVYNIVEANLLKKIEENPEVKYWDFSCNDSPNIPGCQCKNCKKIDKEAGGTGMGSLLPFINKLARKVKQVYPDREIYISTLAYLHTLQPPKNDIKIEDNVVIKLCSMPGDQGTSYLNPGNENAYDFNVFLNSWSKIAKHIVVWDYVVNFANLLLPFPNFQVQQENQLAYENNNIQGIFHQASREDGGEFALLRAYVLSKLMWQGSTMDVSKMVSRFVGAYYGDASEDVIKYLNLLHKNLADSSSNLGLYDSISVHHKGYLSKENLLSYESIINDAKIKVKNDKKILDRVEDIELNIMYAKAILPSFNSEERASSLSTVQKLCEGKNITMVREWQSLQDYVDNYDNELKTVQNQINKPIYIAVGIVCGVIVAVAVILGTIYLVKRKKK